MFIHFFCLCPLGLTIKLNFNLTKVAYCMKPPITNWRLLRKKGVYHFLGQFSFFQDWANSWQTDLFWLEKHCCVIVFVDLRFVLDWNNVCKKVSFPRVSFGDLLLNEKKEKPFVLQNKVTEVWHLPLVVQTDTSFIIHIITPISYCCFVRASK